MDNVCPATGEVYSQVVSSTKQDVDQAVAAGVKAFPAWKKTSRQERVQLMLKLVQLLKRDLKALAQAESRDQGKPLTSTLQGDIPRAIQNFEFFGEFIHQLVGPRWNGEMGDHRVHYDPLGVVANITPWNFPLHILTWKLAPAIATGNCVVAKPSELTPLTAFMFCELVREAGFPPGVINMIHGKGDVIGDHLTTHPHIRAVNFTGSTRTGTHIHAMAAKSLKKVSLEMGGKNPNIIFADCDFEHTLATTLRSSFTNQGEVCTCGSRVFIEQSLYSQFKSRLLDEIPHFEQGAMISEDHLNKVLGYIELAKQEGASILQGGHRKAGPGLHLEPTVIEGLSYDHRVNQEEIFGPVITLTPFQTEEEVIQYANSVDYGLSATVHTTDMKRAERVAKALEVGMVWVNDWMKRDLRTPFGGIKCSGFGREGGLWALQFYTEVKSICYT